MRNLSKQQQKAIKKWFDLNWTGSGSIYTIEQMPTDLQDRIISLNDHETFYQNADRFISDMALEIMYK
ncbi:MAG: hypothetical protein J7L15_00930 [Clostridiales bacterium]|nr:hypothetical protein [Clostridiales bacterium]